MTKRDSKHWHFDTLAIHAGAEPDPATGSVQTPIHQTAAFVFENAEQAADLFALRRSGFVYARLTNPTTHALQERLAALEGGAGATCAASGHAAQILAFFNLMRTGDHFVSSSRLYGGSVSVYSHTFKQFGWNCTFVNPDQPANFKAAIKPETKAIFIENIANPGGAVVDTQAVADIAHNAGIPLIVDSTLATPYLSRPFDHGADIVVHSTTKYLTGNASTVGGVVIDSGKFDWNKGGKFPLMSDPEPAYDNIRFAEAFGPAAFTVRAHALGLRNLGATQSPMNAFLTLLGLETLPLRMQRHVENALKLAKFLESHKAVEHVSYAGLPSSPYYALAQKYAPKGPGSVFTFTVKGGYAAGKKVATSTNIFRHLANVGDARSLIIHPASTTHHQLTEEQLVGAGINPGTVRVSIGIEHADDLIADLEQAISASQKV